DGAGDVAILHGNVIERAVRLDVHDSSTDAVHDGVETRDLLVDGGGDFSGPHGDFDAAEVGGVGVAGMGADANAAFEGEADGALHGVVVPGVTSAGDVGAGDVLHQRGFVLGIGEFAHVAIEIDHM